MLEDVTIRCGAPTLAGIKTGSLFPVICPDREAFLCEMRSLNRILVPKGLCLVPLQYQKQNRVLLYLFRPDQLKRDLTDGGALSLLHCIGYRKEQITYCLALLIKRLRHEKEFPHEIGLFLSYPPEDVRGFIENNARNFKCAGCWKVYGNEAEAKRRFARYKKCTALYCQYHDRGKTIADLAVAV